MDWNMYDRGGIYLAKLYPKKGDEVGKTRPVLILQSDLLNHVGHTTIIIAPLTTRCIDGAVPLRYRINRRDRLLQTSEVLCDQIRAIDIQRLSPQKLTVLSDEEMGQIEEQVKLVLDFD